MKNKNIQVHNEEHEMKLVKRDFLFVIVLNLLLFAAIIGMYFWNRSTGQLDDLLNQVLKF